MASLTNLFFEEGVRSVSQVALGIVKGIVKGIWKCVDSELLREKLCLELN